MARRKGALSAVDPERSDPAARRNRINQFELACQRIEDLLVNCQLQPGRFLTVQELQSVTGFGRTPVHSAVNRLCRDQYNPDPPLLAAAGTQGGALIGALIGGWLSDKIGRRVMFLVTMIMFVVLALAQAFAPTSPGSS